MIWRSLICSSLILITAQAIAAQAATITGMVQLRDSRLDAVNKHKDYAGIIISLVPVGQPPPAPPAKHVVMLQKNKAFTPHVLPVVAGSFVDFPNSDLIFHNAFSSYNGQIFDIGLYPPGTSRSVHFTRPGVVRVFCNIHPSMSAVILVLATPWFAITAKDGSFQVDAPPGTYELSVFHERATEQTLQAQTQRVVLTEQPLALPPIVVSEAGFLLSPHKNKYGTAYAPQPDDKNAYPGVRN
jgi:plastocyanin